MPIKNFTTISCDLFFAVGYNLNYNNYTWKRDPYLKKDINLDNHAVDIEKYYFTYTSDGILNTAYDECFYYTLILSTYTMRLGTQYPGLGVRIELRRHLAYHLIQTYVPR